MASVVAVCGGLMTACSGGGGAPSDLLVTTPDPHITPDAAVAELASLHCTPLGESGAGGSARSDLVLDGPCPFTVHGAVQCTVKPGDFYAYAYRDLPDGDRVDFTVNIENYDGPKEYAKRSAVWIQVKHGSTLYEWATYHGSVTVASDQQHATIAPVALPAWAGTAARGVETARGTVTCSGWTGTAPP